MDLALGGQFSQSTVVQFLADHSTAIGLFFEWFRIIIMYIDGRDDGSKLDPQTLNPKGDQPQHKRRERLRLEGSTLGR